MLKITFMPKITPKTAKAIAALVLAVCLVAVFIFLNVGDGDGNTLLSYGISSDPNPIEVSPEDANPSKATLTIVASNNNPGPIYCNRITFTIPVGYLAKSLTADTKITAQATPSDEWQIARDDSGHFIATPTKPKYNNITADDSLVFKLININVNNKTGIATLTITENSSKDEKIFSDKKGAFDLAKFPYGFYVKDFRPNKPMVQKGETVNLTWTGSDLAQYTIFYDNTSEDVSYTHEWTSPSLNHVTTFILDASAQKNGETVHTYHSTTVTVADS